MIIHNIDPVAFSIANVVSVHWYGIMYMTALLASWFILHILAKRRGARLNSEEVEDLVTWIILGIILGSRLGYVLFYDLSHYISYPLDMFKVWQGGMSFHGGFLGVLSVLLIWSWKKHKNFLDVTDFIAPAVPVGLFFGRMGNFLNGELWGITTNIPWAIVFPSGGDLARHPTQLYEAFLEGVLLFVILWMLAKKPRQNGFLSGIFCIGYAFFRSMCEFFRVPDPQYGYFFEYFTMGQFLSLPMFFIGIYLIARARKLKNSPHHDEVVLEDGTILYVRRK